MKQLYLLNVVFSIRRRHWNKAVFLSL